MPGSYLLTNPASTQEIARGVLPGKSTLWLLGADFLINNCFFRNQEEQDETGMTPIVSSIFARRMPHDLVLWCAENSRDKQSVRHLINLVVECVYERTNMCMKCWNTRFAAGFDTSGGLCATCAAGALCCESLIVNLPPSVTSL